ncbi:MAG TPA: hypothetical protein VIM75_03250 [Ohtaekwangia sp.]|uniref:hypothetical protein n=1 Tax=Ohtaekwangia sp. TaxID=2066019 RepID=UPI002F932294
MITILFIVVVALLAISVARRMHHKLLEKKFTNKLYELRDRLRYLAINGSVENWVFQCLDYSFSKTINEAYYTTLLNLFVTKEKVEDTDGFREFHEKLQASIHSNKELKQIIDGYNKAIWEYVRDQHIIGFTFFIKPILVLIIGATQSKKKVTYLLESFLYKNGDPHQSNLSLSN